MVATSPTFDAADKAPISALMRTLARFPLPLWNTLESRFCCGFPVTIPFFGGLVRATIRRRSMGVQIIAAPWREDLALRIAAHLEREGQCTAAVANL